MTTGDPNLALDPKTLAEIAGLANQAEAPRIWPREDRKAIFTVTNYEDDRGLLLEERVPVKGEHTKQQPRYKLRIVITDQETGRRFVHWEPVEATSPEDAFSQYSTERIQARVQEIIEEMYRQQRAQAAAIAEASRRATGKIQRPGAIIPGTFKR